VRGGLPCRRENVLAAFWLALLAGGEVLSPERAAAQGMPGAAASVEERSKRCQDAFTATL